MADSDLSASELRRRYHKGGATNDDELSASQLRARYVIQSNKKEFSTSSNGREGGISTLMYVIVAFVGVGVIAALVHFFL
jgi:hypothetical protein